MNTNLIPLLIEHCDAKSASASLLWACSKEKLPASVVEDLIMKGADITQSSSGGSALHFAAANADLAKIKVLLLSGADPNLKCLWGTPLERLLNECDVRGKREQECVLLLIDQGATAPDPAVVKIPEVMAAYSALFAQRLAETTVEVEEKQLLGNCPRCGRSAHAGRCRV